MNSMITEYFYARKSSAIIKDEEKLSLEYVPEKLIGREEEYRRLAVAFRRVLRSKGRVCSRVLITGDIGYGKTTLAKRFGMDLEKVGKETGIKIEFIHVEAFHKAPTGVLTNILRRIISNFPERGFSYMEMLMLLEEKAKEENEHLLICIDDADYIRNVERHDILYDLVRMPERGKKLAKISLIIVMRSDISLITIPTIRDYIIDKIELRKYTEQEIFSILKNRVMEAFYPGTVSDEIIEMITNEVANTGNIRRAINLLIKAADEAEIRGSQKIEPEHVRYAIVESTSEYILDEKRLSELSLSEKMTLLAIVECLERKKKAYITMGEAEGRYQVLCEQMGVKPVRHTAFWNYVNQLKKYGLISTRKSGAGIRGQTTLISINLGVIENLKDYLYREVYRDLREYRENT